MKLHYTPRSHFSRKVRILVAGLGLDVELLDVGNVAADDPHVFGQNPLMKVPTLLDGDEHIFDSDHIAQSLVWCHAPDDEFAVLTEDCQLLNARAVMNGAMAAEVEIILARRTGIDTAKHRRFEKHFAAIRSALDWLERRADSLPEAPSYAGFHLVSLWDHLALHDLVVLEHPRLHEHVARLSALPYVAPSAPR